MVRRFALAVGIAFSALVASLSSSAPAFAEALRPPGGALSADKAHQSAEAGELILVDIRTPHEWRMTGAPKNAKRITYGAREFASQLMALRKEAGEKPVVMICATGRRSGHVMRQLKAMGLQENFFHVPEGMKGSGAGPGWLKRGLPVEP